MNISLRDLTILQCLCNLLSFNQYVNTYNSEKKLFSTITTRLFDNITLRGKYIIVIVVIEHSMLFLSNIWGGNNKPNTDMWSQRLDLFMDKIKLTYLNFHLKLYICVHLKFNLRQKARTKSVFKEIYFYTEKIYRMFYFSWNMLHVEVLKTASTPVMCSEDMLKVTLKTFLRTLMKGLYKSFVTGEIFLNIRGYSCSSTTIFE